MSVLVLIPAAGSGTRFGGGIPKQFQPIGGKPMVQYVVERFLLDEAVDRIVVAVAEPLLTIVKQTPDDRVQFVAGGETRQQSVARALAAARGTFDVVAVHDAVRPFFRLSTFHAVIDAARSVDDAVGMDKLLARKALVQLAFLAIARQGQLGVGLCRRHPVPDKY